MKKLITVLLLILIVPLVESCNRDSTPDYRYSQPEQVNDGWDTGTLDQVNIDKGEIADMMDYINDRPGHNIHSILIFKDQLLVFEEYFEGYLYSSNPPGSDGDYIQYDRLTDHYLASISKTITSIIFGAAVKEGFIDNTDIKLIDIFPEYEDILTGSKAEITVKQLLTMSSGLSWDESTTSYGDPSNDVTALFSSDDPLAYILGRPLQYAPGSEFLYNSGGTNVLGAVIEKFTGMSLLDFGNSYLFDPLNIEGGLWQRLPSGYFFASGGLFLRPRELAKTGYLFLNKGYWGDHQVVTEDWISGSVARHIDTEGRTLPMADNYGYQWWIMDFNANGQVYNTFFAAGWGDQYMFVFPEQEMIILFNCGNYLSYGNISPFNLVEDYILDAL